MGVPSRSFSETVRVLGPTRAGSTSKRIRVPSTSVLKHLRLCDTLALSPCHLPGWLQACEDTHRRQHQYAAKDSLTQDEPPSGKNLRPIPSLRDSRWGAPI